LGATSPDTRDAILSWSNSFPVADSTWISLQIAFEISATHQLQIWDALILAVAAESRCRVLASEDFHDGFSWNSVTVVNPFAQRDPPFWRG
jgi:predicted nucleic acid-binding protein